MHLKNNEPQLSKSLADFQYVFLGIAFSECLKAKFNVLEFKNANENLFYSIHGKKKNLRSSLSNQVPL